VNLAHRVVNRALAGEVIGTQSLVDEIGRSQYLQFEPIGEVTLKGVPEPVELFVITPARG
jgi:class 3 adenylate cyclase